jgi:hypothetical protein
MLSFSPYEPMIFAAVLLSLPVFYVLGAFFTPYLSTPWRNVTARTAMGALVFTYILAVGHTGVHTMLLPFGVLLLLFFEPKPLDILNVVRILGGKNFIVIVSLLFFILIIEMLGMDLRDGGDIVVDNWDLAHNAALGHEFYTTGSETSRNILNPSTNHVYYHFFDLWFSGFYSNYLGIIPYYAIGIVYRTLFILLLLLLWYSYAQSYSKKYALIPAFCMLLFTGILPFTNRGFALNDFLWQCSPYFVLATAVVMSLILYNEKKYKAALLITGSLPLIHPMLGLTIPIFFLLLMFQNRINQTRFNFRTSDLLVGLLMGVSTLAYATMDGRMYEPVPNTQYMPIWLAIAGTFLGLFIALASVLPYLIGVWAFHKSESEHKRFHPSLPMLMAVIIALLIIMPIIRGEAAQVLYIVLLIYIVPIGVMGLMLMLSNRIKKIRIYGVVLMGVCTISTFLNPPIRSGSLSIDTILTYIRWSDEEWQTISRVSTFEAEQLILKLNLKNNSLINLGIVINPFLPNKYTEQIFMARLPYLRAFLPGVEVFHLSADSLYFKNNFEDEHKIQLYKRSALWHNFLKTPHPDSLTIAMEQYLKPTYLLLDTSDISLYVPPILASRYTHYDTLGRFILVSQP